MKAIPYVGLRTIGIVSVLGLGLAVAGCDEDGGDMTDDQLGAVPEGEIAPPPAAEEPLLEQPAEPVQ